MPGDNLLTVGLWGDAELEFLGERPGTQLVDSINSLPTSKDVFHYLITNMAAPIHISPIESNVKRSCLFLLKYQ